MATDTAYVMFTSHLVARRRVPAATCSSLRYMLSSFAVPPRRPAKQRRRQLTAKLTLDGKPAAIFIRDGTGL